MYETSSRPQINFSPWKTYQATKAVMCVHWKKSFELCWKLELYAPWELNPSHPPSPLLTPPSPAPFACAASHEQADAANLSPAQRSD